MKRLVILGSTGSIGRSALEVVSQFPGLFQVTGLTAGGNVALLREQIGRFRPDVVAVNDESSWRDLRKSLAGPGAPEMLCGAEGITAVAELPGTDTVLSAIVGSAGLIPTLAAVRKGKTVAIANKETLVMAGSLVMAEVKASGATLLPVDSEHSAIFQCINGRRDSVRKMILTASGGPFAGRTRKELQHVSPGEALNHPNWSMGRKITIDSATLMNKGLEVIEAHHLFDMPAPSIDVVIHPQSIIHSIVEFHDGSYLAQLSRPDMKGPIAMALAYPERLRSVMEPLDWDKLSRLTFRKPDTGTFPCLNLAYRAVASGGTLPAVLNAANEVAVQAFLDGVIGFNDIPVIIEKVMNSHDIQSAVRLGDILEADLWARSQAGEAVKR